MTRPWNPRLRERRQSASSPSASWMSRYGPSTGEYWIVNPLDETIAVLVLRDGAYVEHGVFARGQQATSMLIPGFSVAVSQVFDIR